VSENAARLGRERVDRGVARVDLRGEATIPRHDDTALLVDLRDDAAISGAQTRVVARSLDELDPRTDRDACADPRRKKPGTLRVHTTHIGFEGPRL
jgi:hypothetical protein